MIEAANLHPAGAFLRPKRWPFPDRGRRPGGIEQAHPRRCSTHNTDIIPMKAFAAFRSLLVSKAPRPEDLAKAVEAARQARDAAQADHAALAGQSRALLVADDATRARHKQALAAAADTLTDAGLYLESLEEKLVQAEARVTNDRRMAVYADAKAKSDGAAARLSKEYPDLVRKGLSLLLALAEAEVAIERANRDLPEGIDPLVSPDAQVRGVPGAPSTVLREKVVELWCRPGSDTPVPEEIAAEIRATSGKKGTRTAASGPGHSQVLRTEEFEKRKFRRIEMQPSRVAEVPTRLLFDLRLPPVSGHAGPGWHPTNLRGVAHALAELQRLASEPLDRKPEEAPVEVQLVALGFVGTDRGEALEGTA
ncbi:hypothetical protein V5F77_02540 [Xanthobacter sp. DSM 24535]|uniref:hypothetical protein n=1 Tax=Roseixanthobacter psychrophilus TaxID=3119917 RepID=UPI00372AB906